VSFNVIETGIEGLRIIQARIFRDERGYFLESYSRHKLKEAGVDYSFVQDNISRSKRGVLRGLHYQLDPMSQTKLLTVMSGRIIDAVVDLRKGSPTYGKHYTVELNSEDSSMVIIPKGFAHGFVSLSDDTVIMYKCDNYYSPEHERGVKFNDPDLSINWKIPEDELIIADRDRNFPCFADAEMNFVYGK